MSQFARKKRGVRLAVAMGPWGSLSFHLSSTLEIRPSGPTWMSTTESMTFSVPRPLRTYLLERRREMGSPEEVTSWDWIVIGEKRATRPYHWAANLSKPTALVIGS